MLQILFGILKIIGILLLAVLGIVLLLLLVILLVPVRYRAEVAFDGKPWGNVNITWLLRLLRVRIRYEEGLKWSVHAACFKVKDSGTPANQTASEEETSGKTNHDGGDALDDMWLEDGEASGADMDESLSGGNAGSAEMDMKSVNAAGDQEHHSEQNTDHPIQEDKVSLTERLRRKFGNILQKISEKLRGLRQTLQTKTNALQEKYEEIRTIVTDEANQKTFRLLCRQTKKLLCHLLPTKCRGRVRFGFEDPATTGQILMYLSPFYGWYRDALRIEPVFDEKVTEGELWIKGRIRLGTLLWIVIRLFLDKNFRQLLKRRKH